METANVPHNFTLLQKLMSLFPIEFSLVIVVAYFTCLICILPAGCWLLCGLRYAKFGSSSIFCPFVKMSVGIMCLELLMTILLVVGLFSIQLARDAISSLLRDVCVCVCIIYSYNNEGTIGYRNMNTN